MSGPKTFAAGQAVVWEPKNFNPEYWNNLSEADRVRYYGWTGYGQQRRNGPKVFVFLCPVLESDGTDSGHCVLVDLDDGHVEHMRHTSEFRVVTEDEL